MSKSLHRILIVAILSLSSLVAGASESLVDSIVRHYNDWERVEVSGKFMSEKLPVSPTVKLYMERGKTLRISLRVPLMGELGRVEVNGDTLLLLNRHNKTYCQERLGDVIKVLSAGIEDLQSLLLGRVFILNHGTLSAENADAADLFVQDDSIIVLPEEQPLDGMVRYGFATTLSGILCSLQALTEDTSNILGVDYAFKGEKMDMTLNWKDSKHNLNVIFRFDAPSWEGKGMARASISSKMKRLGISAFFKSI
jgi:hypothetical protein